MPVTLQYFDLEKCFDRLWLRKCMMSLWKSGVRGPDTAEALPRPYVP